jgi:hypothetical protein
MAAGQAEAGSWKDGGPPPTGCVTLGTEAGPRDGSLGSRAVAVAISFGIF